MRKGNSVKMKFYIAIQVIDSGLVVILWCPHKIPTNTLANFFILYSFLCLSWHVWVVGLIRYAAVLIYQ